MTPMDVLSNWRVPFDVAAWCRGRLCVQSLNLKRATERLLAAQKLLEMSEDTLRLRQTEFDTALQVTKEKMSRD